MTSVGGHPARTLPPARAALTLTTKKGVSFVTLLLSHCPEHTRQRKRHSNQRNHKKSANPRTIKNTANQRTAVYHGPG